MVLNRRYGFGKVGSHRSEGGLGMLTRRVSPVRSSYSVRDLCLEVLSSYREPKGMTVTFQDLFFE